MIPFVDVVSLIRKEGSETLVLTIKIEGKRAQRKIGEEEGTYGLIVRKKCLRREN